MSSEPECGHTNNQQNVFFSRVSVFQVCMVILAFCWFTSSQRERQVASPDSTVCPSMDCPMECTKCTGHMRRFINQLLLNSELENAVFPSDSALNFTLTFHLTQENLKILQDFGSLGNVPFYDLDQALTQMLRVKVTSSTYDPPSFLNRFFSNFTDGPSWMIPYFIIAVFLISVTIYPWKQALLSTVFILFLVEFVYTYDLMLNDAFAKHQANINLYPEKPAGCSVNFWGLWSNKAECEEYFKVLSFDPTMISPLDVFMETSLKRFHQVINKIFELTGEGIRHLRKGTDFLSSFFLGLILPIIVVLLGFVGIFCLFVLFFGKELRFRNILGSVEVMNSKNDHVIKQAIQPPRSPVEPTPVRGLSIVQGGNQMAGSPSFNMPPLRGGSEGSLSFQMPLSLPPSAFTPTENRLQRANIENPLRFRRLSYVCKRTRKIR